MEKEINLSQKAFTLNLENLNSRVYKVSVKYFDGDDLILSKRIDYDTEFIFTPYQKFYLLDIFKQNIWYNGHSADSISERIAEEFTHSLYPIQLKIDKEKMIFYEISNHKQILRRWYTNIDKVKQKYDSEIFRKLCSTFQKHIENRLVFEKSLQYDWMINLLFHPIHKLYGTDNSISTQLLLSVIPYQSPIRFSGTQTINTKITDYNSIEIIFKSNETPIPKGVNENYEENMLMSLNVYFDVDSYHHFPMHIRAYFELYTKDENHQKKIIKKIQFSLYQSDI